MRVLLIIAGLGMGGAERVASLLTRAWAEQGKQISIVAFDSPKDPLAYDFHKDVELIRLDIAAGGGSLLRGILANARRFLALRRLFRERRPDLVISFLTKVNVLSLLAAIGSDVPVIISERNNPAKQQANALWSWSWAMLSRFAAAIVLQTETIKSRYTKDIADRAVVIPNPVEKPDLVRQNHDGHVIVAAGRLAHQKGFDLLIAAFALLAADFPDWRLVIWGEGSERASLEQQIRDEALTGRIMLPGMSLGHGQWLATADAFVLSSRFEGFGNVLVEAMLAGIPAIAFDCDFGPRDILTDGVDGILVPCGDTQLLAVAMRQVMTNEPLRARLGAAARINAGRFDLATIVSQWDSLTKKVLYSA